VLNLPAIAAVATVAAIPTASAATAASAAISTTASAATAASTAAARTLGLRARFIYHQVPATEVLTIEIGNRAIRFFIVCDFDERKSARLPRETIPYQIDRGRVHAYLSEPFLQLFFGCRKREITDVKLLHLRTPFVRNLTTIAERTEKPVPPGGQTRGVPRGRGRSVVPEILSKIDWFCNQKRWYVGVAKREVKEPYGREWWYDAPTFPWGFVVPVSGTMMGFPLTLPTMLERAGKLFARVEIVSRRPDLSIVRSNYGEFYKRARRLAVALHKLGLQSGDRVASLMWNHASHLDAFWGVPCAGGILHTLNLRLHPHEIAAIVNHAQDRFLIVDDVLLPLFDKFAGQVSFERVIVAPYGFASVPEGFLNYEELLADASDDFSYPALEENQGAAMCFTSGTTGCSKGVIYSHRALVLHSFALGLDEVFGLSSKDTILPMVPMFHANSWGIPFGAPMLGTKLVLPGPHLDGENLLNLMEQEHVNKACGVPTIWAGILAALEKNPERWKLPSRIFGPCGGSAPPLELMRRLDRFGIEVKHLWGMTETSPIGTGGALKPHMKDWPDEKKYEVRSKQGWPAPFVEARIMKEGAEAPWDGETAGELEVRGPWIAGKYYEAPDQAARWSNDGWFRTGDVATIDSEGYIRLVDRAKDLVKSGGEWISSVDLENALMGHDAVKEACVIGLPHPKWQERPLAAVVLREGAHASEQELREFLAKSFASWQLPDAFVFMDAIPRTSVGKFKKTALREQFAGWQWKS